MISLAAAFLATAFLYSMAGFGGGSTYNALLVLSGVDYLILPSIALVCNILVVANGSREFVAAKQVRLRDAALLCVLSAPAAWAGGRMPISEETFVGLLGIALLVAGILMFVDFGGGASETPRARPLLVPIGIGGGIGFLSGIVGIGGGIFLAPLLHLIKWGGARAIAGAASIFILVNSIAGLGGQLMKLGDLNRLGDAAAYWPLPLSVIAGGAVGSFLSARRLPSVVIKRVTGILILLVAARLLWRTFGT